MARAVLGSAIALVLVVAVVAALDVGLGHSPRRLAGVDATTGVSVSTLAGPGPVATPPAAASVVPSSAVGSSVAPTLPVGSASSGGPVSSTAKGSPSARASSSVGPRSSTSRPPAGPPGLVVLNDSRVGGLAARAATHLRAAGWPVVRVGNLEAHVPVTTAFYDPAVPAYRAAAQRLAAAGLGVRAAAPRPAYLPGGGFVLVVTRDYRA